MLKIALCGIQRRGQGAMLTLILAASFWYIISYGIFAKILKTKFPDV